MRFRIIFFIISCFIIIVSINAEKKADDLPIKDDQVQSVFNVLYSLETWGMAHEDEHIIEMLNFVKNNPGNKFNFVLCDELKRQLSWQNFNLYKKVLNTVNFVDYSGWNKRFLEDLLIKFNFYKTDTNAIASICKTRIFPSDYYVVGPLKKNWNQLLRTQWSYLFNPETIFNTPFGAKKYEKIPNNSYIDNITNKSHIKLSSDNVDFNSCTYLCSFTAFFEAEADVLLRVNSLAEYLYINGVPLSMYFSERFMEKNRLFPLKFAQGRYDFIFQSSDYPENLDIEFLPANLAQILKIKLNSHYKNDYGYFLKAISGSSNELQYVTLKNYAYIQNFADTNDSSMKQVLLATKLIKDYKGYESWVELKKLYNKNKTPINSYLVALATSTSEILPANIKQTFIPSIYTNLSENSPRFVLPLLQLYNYYFNHNKYSEALKILEGIISIDPENKKAWSELIDFYDRESWGAQKYATILMAAEKFPDDVNFQLMKISALKKHQNNSDALKIYSRLTKILPVTDDTYFIWKNYANTFAKSGESFENKNRLWLNFVNLFQSTTEDAEMDYCKFLIDNGKYENALERLNNLFKNKSSSKIAKLISQLYFILNNNVKGLKYLEKSHTLNKKLNSAEKEYLLNLKNDNDLRLYEKYTIPIDEILNIEIEPGDYPDSASVVLLDEEIKRIFPDGSSTSIITVVRKILTSEGAEEYGIIPVDGDVVQAKVIKPNGEIIEPSVVGSSINFQGIEIGSTQIIITREVNEEFNVSFYFSDPEHKEHFLTSRFVILKPREFKDFKIEEHFISRLKLDITEKYDVYLYELKNSKPIPEVQDYDPGISDYLPHIELTNLRIEPQNFHFYFLEEPIFYSSTSLIDEKCKSLCENLDSEFEKAKTIYNFVAQNITYDFFVDDPTETLLNLSGDNIKLLLALYKAANIKFKHVKILTPYEFKQFSYSKKFDSIYNADYIDALQIYCDKKYFFIILDANNMKNIQFGIMPYVGNLAFEFKNKIDCFDVDVTNNSDILLDKTNFDINLNDSEISTKGSLVFNLNVTLSLKNLIDQFDSSLMNKLLTDILNDKLGNITISDFTFLNKNTSSPLKMEINGKLVNSIQKIDNHRLEISLCLPLLNLISKYTPSNSRQIKLKVIEDDYDNFIDTRVIHIPDDYIVQNMPASGFFITKGFIYLLNIERLDNKIVITRKWRNFPALYDVDEYEQLKQYCQAIDTLEKTGITLLKIEDK